MTYATLNDLQLAVPPQTLVWLSNDDDQAAAISVPVVEQALEQANELIDAHLRGRYSLPLPNVPAVIRNAAVHLARHWLYARRPEGAALPDAVTRSYKAAMQLLEAIRDSKISLGMPGQNAGAEPGSVRMRTKPKRFAATELDRY